ncbi:MAG: 3'-phosphoesterase [Bacteroidota bacterium]|nr:3'-phosphoesterase [Bacteroidota bacterium]
MALETYKKKRDFKQTAEPKGDKKSIDKNLIFVVQKHSATRLHYDFRLELNGVLISWAVPKGPSLNPANKRLAVHVEDHPFDYKDFEGIIPEGNYGAGQVIVWDKGIYMPVEGTTCKKENEKLLSKAFRKGDVKIILLGKKLKGEFALIKMKSEDEKAWLLIKKKDEYATKVDILKNDKSVISANTIEKLKSKKKKNG